MSTCHCKLIQQQIGALFECTNLGRYLRIRTPFTYPDGDFIDLFCPNNSNDMVFNICDLGETTRWLRMQSATMKRSPRQNLMIADICDYSRVEFVNGMLVAHCDEASGFAEAVFRLGRTAMRIADISFTFRNRSVVSIHDEVGEFLEESGLIFDRNVIAEGGSGKKWPIDFEVTTKSSTSLIHVLSTGSRAATNRMTEHLVAMWHDLSKSSEIQSRRFVTLFDDTIDVWTSEDFLQLEDLSEIARWSDPDRLVSRLQAV